MNYRTVDHGWFGRSMVIWWWVPFVSHKWGVTKVPTIYLKKGVDEFTLIHEMVHVEQWVEKGRWKFLREWLTKRGRLHIEAVGTAARIKAKVDKGGYEPVGLIEYYAATYPKSYRLGDRWSTAELKEILWGYYDDAMRRV